MLKECFLAYVVKGLKIRSFCWASGSKLRRGQIFSKKEKRKKKVRIISSIFSLTSGENSLCKDLLSLSLT